MKFSMTCRSELCIVLVVDANFLTKPTSAGNVVNLKRQLLVPKLKNPRGKLARLFAKL
jgi:hypothetical protein